MPQVRLMRSSSDRIIAGVCGGLAAYLGLDPVLVRLAFLILLFASGIGVPVYLVLWVIMPKDEAEKNMTGEDRSEGWDKFEATGASPVGRPATVGIIMIVLGMYFLFNQIGFPLGGIIWPLVIIGLGIYFITQRQR